MGIARFTLITGIISFILSALGAWIVYRFLPQYNLYATVGGVLVMFVMTLAAYILAYRGISRNARQFTALFLSGMGIKMMLGIISVLIIGLLAKEILSEYVVSFFLSYFVLTTFEVYGLIRKLREVS